MDLIIGYRKTLKVTVNINCYDEATEKKNSEGFLYIVRVKRM